jgi:hypothetical protein
MAKFGAVAAGACAMLMLFARQSFVLSFTAVALVLHLRVVRQGGDLRRLLTWELVGFAAPVAAWFAYLVAVGGTSAFFDVVRDSLALVGQPGKGSMIARMSTGLGWMVHNVFAGRNDVAWLTLGGGAIGVALAQVAGRSREAEGLPPLLLPLWFLAELVAAAAPAEYYGHQYIPFVPIWAVLAALVVQVSISPSPRSRWQASLPVVAVVGLIGAGVTVLDAPFRADPEKFWFTYAPNAHLPPEIVQRFADGSRTNGWRSYVPLDTMGIAVLLDMPLRPATRFVNQYTYQFADPDTRRRTELLDAVRRTDVVVEEKRRQRLGNDVERELHTLLASTFLTFIELPDYRFYVRRNIIR